MHRLEGKFGVSTGSCKPFIGYLDECIIKGKDGANREYRCVPGHKCTKRSEDDEKRCWPRYELRDGEKTKDPELCQSGHTF